jgi:hypothetical protein
MHKSIFFIRVGSDFHEKLVKNKNPVARAASLKFNNFRPAALASLAN